MNDPSPHILVLHRWRDGYALYSDYLDHSRYTVTYVTTELGRSAVPVEASGVVIVSATDDGAAVRRALEQLVSRFGAPARLIALNEGDLDLAAQLRVEWNLPGQRPAELAPFRDKLVMAVRAAEVGLRIPAFADAPTVAAVAAFAADHGWPLVVKPRRGTASRGITRLDGADQLADLELTADDPQLVQRFVDGQILHIDGLWTGTELGPWRASRYVNTCADFADGTFLGSAEIDDVTLLPAIERFAAQVAGGFSSEPWVFHLEAFLQTDESGQSELTFLECGARVGGAEIPFVWREVHGVDLMTAAFSVQLGLPPAVTSIAPGEVGGWLLLPTSVAPPCTVVQAQWRPSDSVQPHARPYAEVIPQAGFDVPRVGGYEHVGARFRFRGGSTEAVLASITSTVTDFVLDCVPTPDPALMKEAT